MITLIIFFEFLFFILFKDFSIFYLVYLTFFFNPMIIKYKVTPELINKLPLLLKYTKELFIDHSIISAENIRIKLNYFLNFNFGIKTIDFVEMITNTDAIEVENNIVKYKYAYKTNGNMLVVNKTVAILNTNYNTDIPALKLSIKVSGLKILTKNKILISVDKNSMILSSDDRIKTYAYHKIERLNCEEEEEECFVRGESLKIIEELDKDLVISFFPEFIAIHEFSDATITSIFIPKILF